jgi:transcriptional regulator with XRE-family HTH domain
MQLIKTYNDQTILKEIGERMSMLRLNRNLTQAELAEKSGVSKRTVERLEAGKAVQTTSLIRLFRSLDLLNAFEATIPKPIPSPVAQIKLQGKTRKRASAKKEKTFTNKWKWRDES